ncbi:hypothetical protein SBF1_2840004 [Candidatus Desulfosporosinus infrequens]|uniref:Uncharacterized protein n=1 Tax=Candidatus Desulfosporosinus infrequens TaxID=2043169 RepID=A0A2U3KUY4_9FIRM|nr:hypothetical protein SBF1_2840004 [Candidatus Desulfosporosinus infrequens]
MMGVKTCLEVVNSGKPYIADIMVQQNRTYLLNEEKVSPVL